MSAFRPKQRKLLKILSKISSLAIGESANISTVLTIYANDLETIMNAMRGVFAMETLVMHARIVTIAAAALRASTSGMAAEPVRSRPPQRTAGRRALRRRPWCSRRPIQLPATRADQPRPPVKHRAGRITTCRCGDPQPTRPEAAAISPTCAARSAASRGSPGFRRRRRPRTPTSRMGATYWRRPSAGAATCAAR